MTFGPFQRASLGHLLWWTASTTSVDTEARAGELEETMRLLPGIPVLERSGVFWLAPELQPRLDAFRSALSAQRGWELHLVQVRADPQTVEALRASARRWLDATLSHLSGELELLLVQPRQRASLLVRQLDVLELIRRQAEVHTRRLGLTQQGLPARLDSWAARIDAALCARIVA